MKIAQNINHSPNKLQQNFYFKKSILSILLFALILKQVIGNTNSCLKNAFPMFLGGLNGVTQIHSMDIYQENIVISGFSNSSDILNQAPRYGAPFIALIEEGNIYRWAKTFWLEDQKPFIKVSYSLNNTKVIAIRDGLLYLNIQTNYQQNFVSKGQGQAVIISQSSNQDYFYIGGTLLYDEVTNVQISTFSILSLNNQTFTIKENYLIKNQSMANKETRVTQMCVYKSDTNTSSTDIIIGTIEIDWNGIDPSIFLFQVEVDLSILDVKNWAIYKLNLPQLKNVLLI
ncbi:UNKNOWN [Stylonychia lemnae]|uniref:Uncharacterized protein n=1 Tax=Stylonychia lemnae TaxID=5949 RepID=A0A078AGB7_STYLE|nr:UNKNOWN [Stylonychia lemnae]|eukprot:CDW81279.1 UNKNOWN [Stylonychia lemnae]